MLLASLSEDILAKPLTGNPALGKDLLRLAPRLVQLTLVLVDATIAGQLLLVSNRGRR